MIGALVRKARQLVGDPALRRYLLERAMGRTAAPRRFVPGHPPYLADLALPLPSRLAPFAELPAMPPTAPLTLSLPGACVTLSPQAPGALFDQDFPDIETRLAVHRFAWLPLQADGLDPAWVCALWQEWRSRFGSPGPGWDWHPYTAAERLINLLDFARRSGGLPGPVADTVAVLAAHGPAIAARLEYSGDHYTGNHLSNNGRGLFLLGCALGWDRCAELGAEILLAEAGRIFTSSGLLREESSHYHLLLTRNYISAWLAARRFCRPESEAFAGIAARALTAAAIFSLPGGLPLVGDISPDCPPAFLAGLLPGGTGGWLALLTDDERRELAALPQPALGDPVADGWARADQGDWALLVHAGPQGWPFIPGHGHHDLGGFELHWRGLPLIVDPGRGAYGDSGEAALYRSAAVHNGLTIDGADPTAANRPYYGDDFRRREGGEPPVLRRRSDGIDLVHGAFRRQGVRWCERNWTVTDMAAIIDDRVDGRGRRRLARMLTTPWPVRIDGDVVVIETPRGQVRVVADGAVVLRPVTRWIAYGQGEAATQIAIEDVRALPWSGRIILEAV
ncbi:conserved hypothetical protein [Magnetospirillum sp. LM-5]|uniref:heparinase II/III domain-containing protein n=1 Tax=Magnetospirillum sp. LM-5 TaxID=2681466 RepID=UPI00137CC82E|nr:heparinase II/III family protein [Magnetospirillum sp. LM-5]CAA7622537.1 conserved hypothetical protein [Magnetospirillum sp. LM-5]